jgi:hypothetical protein
LREKKYSSMQQITSIEGLRVKIRQLKDEQARQEKGLKEQFNRTLVSLKPVNLARSTVNHIVTSPYLIDNIVGIGVGLATGFLSKRIVAGVSRSIIRRLVGVFLQAGVSRLVSRRPEGIAPTRHPIFRNIFLRKD